MNEIEFPHKWVYLDGGSCAWRAVREDPAYDLGLRELETLRKFMPVVASLHGDHEYNVVHVGPGTGVEARLVISALGPERIPAYGIVDISPELLDQARETLAAEYKPLRVLAFHHDVSQSGMSAFVSFLRQSGTASNLVVLAANGGILADPASLRLVVGTMLPGDRLLITLEIYEREREADILNQYRLPSILNLFRRSLYHFGIPDPRDEEFQFSYDSKRALIEVFFVPNAARTTPSLPDRIRVFATYRPTPAHLREALETHGLQVPLFEQFEDEHCCGVLCAIPDQERAQQAQEHQ
jgi:hypothetical protein